MTTALAIIGSFVAALTIWALGHAQACAVFHERLARLEERLGIKHDRD